jgi:hypothetical protein
MGLTLFSHQEHLATVNHSSGKLRRILLWLMGGIFVLTLAIIFRINRTQSEVQRYTERLRAEGYPTNIEELNTWNPPGTATQTRTEADNASPFIFAAIEKLTDNQPLAVSRSILPELHAALALPYCSNPAFDPNSSNLDQLAQLKRASRVLSNAAKAAADEGAWDEATDHLIAGIRLSHSLRHNSFIIHWLVAVALEAVMVGALESVLESGPMPPDNLTRLHDALDPDRAIEAYKIALIGERAFGLQSFADTQKLMLQMMAAPAPGGVGGPPPTVNPAARFGASLYSKIVGPIDHRYYRNNMDLLIEEADHLDRDAWDFGATIESDTSSAMARFTPLAKGSILAIARASQKKIRHVATLRAARTALAIELYRAQHQDRVPNSLDQLVPTFLNEIPIDPMDNLPLKYRVRSPGYVVYSIGETFRDDGGISHQNRDTSLTDENAAWDFTFEVKR